MDRADPLSATPEPPDRVNYATGVLLNAEDFEAEQLYHRGRLARALAYLHGSGTVAGLRVEWQRPLNPGDDPQLPAGREEGLVVQPGIAIDRLGRIVELQTPACIRLDRWYRGQPADALIEALHPRTPPLPDDPYGGVVVDLFIRFHACERGKTPAFAAGPFDALDAVVASRLRDAYRLELVLRPEDAPPQPRSRWPDGSAIADAPTRAATLRSAIYDAWREGTDSWNDDGPLPLPEHAPGQNPTAIFLARLVLPATAEIDDLGRPTRTAGEDVTIQDEARPFVYPTDLLAQLAGLIQGYPLPEEGDG
jgi:hypothetical protein